MNDQPEQAAFLKPLLEAAHAKGHAAALTKARAEASQRATDHAAVLAEIVDLKAQLARSAAAQHVVDQAKVSR